MRSKYNRERPLAIYYPISLHFLQFCFYGLLVRVGESIWWESNTGCGTCFYLDQYLVSWLELSFPGMTVIPFLLDSLCVLEVLLDDISELGWPLLYVGDYTLRAPPVRTPSGCRGVL